MPVSIIIPVLNEETSIEVLLKQLQGHRQQGHEVIVVDGGSKDKTISIAKVLADKIIQSQSGRALQMNKGAEQASFEYLWFLHADTLIPEKAAGKIETCLADNHWGRFNIRLSGSGVLFRIIETMINIRSSLSGVATGDQGIFVKQKTFESVGGYSKLPLMEDVELSKKLKRVDKPVCLKEELITSSRRWEHHGVFSTIFLMWKLRFLYWLGVSAERLALQYK